jgi:hypothetical protein
VRGVVRALFQKGRKARYPLGYVPGAFHNQTMALHIVRAILRMTPWCHYPCTRALIGLPGIDCQERLKMRSITVFISIALVGAFTPMLKTPAAEDASRSMDQIMSQHEMPSTDDNRISLHLAPEMKQHQLSMMRSHLTAIQSIIGLLSAGDFDQAAQIAHTRLGLTEQMKMMCAMPGNEQFRRLGLAFHNSADTLGDTLKTKDLDKSLHALHTTMGYCVQCHATFRQ